MVFTSSQSNVIEITRHGFAIFSFSFLLLVLPLIWGIDGIWLAVPVAEAVSLFVSVYCLIRYKKIYKY
ncbi:MAG: hypothetical protein KHZ06_07440 [Blautia sp.]|jgi:Na+-driven multidrug efflux pump|nr:hypothetical protein [Blautia sp.]